MIIFPLIKKSLLYWLCLIALASCIPINNSNDEITDIEIATLVLNLDKSNTPTTEILLDETASQEKTPEPTIEPCLLLGGSLVEGSLSTSKSEYPLDYIVYTPPCYQQHLDEDYPVLYLFHGQGFRQDQWLDLGAIEVADRLIASGEMAPLIIVMPRDRVWSQPSEDIFGQAVIDLLIPYIDSNYRSKSDRENRAVGGVSRGGAWSLNLGLKNWELFSRIGMHSPALFWDDLYSIPSWVEDIPENKYPRIFFDYRQYEPYDIEDSVAQIEEDFLNNNIPHEYYQLDGGHNEDSWSQDVETYMRFYTLDW